MEIPVGNKFTENEINTVEEALNIKFTDLNKRLLIEGNSTDILELDGRECKLSLQRNKKGEVLALVNNKKEILEIPSEIQGKKLSRNDKKLLYDGHCILVNSKKGDFYLQIDKELNTVIIKGSQEMGIPDVIGDDKKHKFKGYVLTTADKELLANGKSLPPRVICSKDGYLLTEFGLTQDRKGVTFSHTISIPKEEVDNYIAKYNSNEIAQDNKIDKNEQLVEQKKEVRNLTNADVYTNHDLLKLIAQDGASAIVLSDITNKENLNEFLSTYNLKDDFEKWEKSGMSNELDDKVKQVAQLEADKISGNQFLFYFKNGDFNSIKQLANEGYFPHQNIVDEARNLGLD